MSVQITKTGGHAAAITWDAGDDPHGYLARTVEGDQLAYALEVLARTAPAPGRESDPDHARLAARSATELGRLLTAGAARYVVHLRDVCGLSWRQISAAVHDDPEKQSTVKRQYDSGRRQMGI